MDRGIVAFLRRSLARAGEHRLTRAFAGPRFDVVLATTFLAVGTLVGAIHVDRVGQGQYYQREFSPAVMVACGHGFTSYEGDDQLEAFLEQRATEYECPQPFVRARASTPSLFAHGERYLMTAAGLIWKVTGVGWDALLPLFALLYGMTCLALYGLFRLVCGRLFSTVFGAVASIAPAFLDMLPHLRDFSKAPFLLGGIVLGGLAVKRRFGTRGLVALGAGAGLLAGVGAGFRGDTTLILPLFGLAIVFFTPWGLRGALAARAAALAAMVATFLVAAAPLFLPVSDDVTGSTTLMAVHGLTDEFATELGLERDLYSPGYVYNDSYAIALVNAHARLIDGERGYRKLESKELETSSRSLYLAALRTFPADWYARVQAAVVRAVEAGAYGPRGGTVAPGTVEPNNVLQRIRNELRDGIRSILGVLSLPLLALLLGAVLHFRGTLFALTAVVFLAAVTTVQFSFRHMFYLEPLWWLAAAFLLDRMARLAFQAWRRRDELRSRPPAWRELRGPLLRIGIVVALLVVGSFGVLLPLRAYQDRHVLDVLERYEAAPRFEVRTRDRPAGSGRTVVEVVDLRPWVGEPEQVSALFVATFDRARCSSIVVNPVARYGTSDAFLDWSTPLDVRLSRRADSSWAVYFLAFRGTDGGFRGIELPAAQRPCLSRFEAVSDTSRLPMLFYANLPADWREATRYETFAKWEDRRSIYDGTVQVVTSAKALPPFQPDRVRGTQLSWEGAAYVDPDVRIRGAGWEHDAKAGGRYAYLVQAKDMFLPRGRYAVVHGFVDRGGLTIGLLFEGEWAGLTNVLDRGEFYAVLESTGNNRYALVVANNVLSDDARNDVRIESVTWGVVLDADREGRP